MTEFQAHDKKPCVWATSKERWDSFLNDPELARAIDSVRQAETDSDKPPVNAIGEQSTYASDDESNEESADSIGARLRAYETPVTDEVLRQSIR